MYSVVLMAALTAGGQTPDWHSGHSCNSGGYGSCYGGCYGNYGIDSYNCGGGSCWGAGYGSCWGAGYGTGWGGGTCWGGSCYGGWGACSGGCYGSAYPWDYSSCGCNGGCWGASSEGSPYFATPPMPPPEPPVKGEPIPEPKKTTPESQAPTSNALLIVEVPADAKLYIDDQPMKTKAERRTYQTPALEAGQTFFYEVRVEVERDGKMLSTTKRVLLRAGQEVHADFKDMDATTTAKAK